MNWVLDISCASPTVSTLWLEISQKHVSFKAQIKRINHVCNKTCLGCSFLANNIILWYYSIYRYSSSLGRVVTCSANMWGDPGSNRGGIRIFRNFPFRCNIIYIPLSVPVIFIYLNNLKYLNILNLRDTDYRDLRLCYHWYDNKTQVMRALYYTVIMR